MHDDIRSITELTHIARVYLSRDELDRAAEIMALVEKIQHRLEVEHDVVNMVDWWQFQYDDETGKAS